MSSFKDRTWLTRDALAVACCIFRKRGYTNSSVHLSDNPTSDQRYTSKDMLTYALLPEVASHDYILQFIPAEEDTQTADNIITHFRKLTFGIIDNSLNDYMNRVYAVTQAEKVDIADLGVLASVPQTYDREIQTKQIKNVAKETKQEYLGQEGAVLTLHIQYINTRFVPNLNCYAHDAVTDTNHLVNFLSKTELGKAGTCHTIRARVKKHGVNYQTKTIETQLNYVKILDRELVWQ